MVPESVSALIAFLLFVAPGAVYEERVQRRRAHLRSTVFREVNRVVLVSVGTWLIPAFALVLLNLKWDVPLRVLAGRLRWENHPEALLALVGFVGMALLSAWAMAAWVTRNEHANLIEATGWHVAFSKLRKDNEQELQVMTESGDVWRGDFAGADLRDVSREDRDLTLKPPIGLRYKGTTEFVDIDTDFVTLSGADIRAIIATNIRAGAPPADKRP